MTRHLPPTDLLVLEVLAARHRLGEARWPFPPSCRGALERLAEAGLITVCNDIEAALTDAGRADALYPDWRPAYEKAREDIADDLTDSAALTWWMQAGDTHNVPHGVMISLARSVSFTLRRYGRLITDDSGTAEESTRPRDGWMQTFTGRAFYPLAPRVEDVDPLDIAHALSMICRYGGHVNRPYSVAEHCVLMSEAVPQEDALWALLHDGTEAYVGDMVRPLKRALPSYCDVEDRIMRVICDRFGLAYDCPPTVKLADTMILHDERAALMGPSPMPWTALEQMPPLGVTITGWPPAEAERRYLDRLAALTGSVQQ